MMNEQINNSNSIDFDININDLNKLTILVENISNGSNKNFKKTFECDCFSQNECHHTNDEHNYENCIRVKCSYCSFFDYLTNTPNISSLKLSEKHRLFVNYRKYSSYQYLNWCELQPRRRPFGLITYSTCNSKSDLLHALRSFEKLKQEFKNLSFQFKLFVNLEELNQKWIDDLNLLPNINQNDVNLNRLTYRRDISNYSLPASLPLINRDSALDIEDLNEENDSTSNQIFNRQTSNSSDSNNDEINLDSNLNNNNDLMPNQDEKNLQTQMATIEMSLKENEKNVMFDINDEIELNEKLRSYENDLIFMEKNKSNKIDASLHDFLSSIFKQLLNLAKSINPNEDSQLNFYSDFLKLPYEKSNSSQSSNNNLTMKMVNKKKISIRMNKYKADLMMCLNLIDSAVYYYSQAYNLSRKDMNSDHVWAHSSLEGLCVSSYFHSKENPNQYNNSNNKTNNVKQIGKTIRKAFSTATVTNSSSNNSNNAIKDVSLLVISYNEFAKHFDDIIRSYDRNEQTKFLAFETALMIIRFFIRNNFRFEALNFITYTIYITNLQIKEEIRIRRYLEIGKLYDSLEMKRLGTFYKWVSIVRIFKLIDKKQKQIQDVNLKCLISRCCHQLISLFDSMKIEEQKKPLDAQLNESNGFPQAKLHVLAQLVQLSSYNSKFYDCIKYCKYLIHEFESHMDLDDFKYFLDFYYNLSNKTNNFDEQHVIDDTFFKKFYKFPQLISFDVLTQTLPSNTKMTKIVELDDTVYKFRYDPLQSRKKIITYNLPVNESNKICFRFFNPTQFDLEVESLSLVIFKNHAEETISLENFEKFNMTSKSERKSEYSFKYYQTGSLKIIGYEIKTLKFSNRILFKEFKSTNQQKQLIQPEYDIEMIPQIPIINNLRLVSNEYFTVFDCHSQSKGLLINSRLGQCDILNIEYLTSASSNSNFEIISFNIIILNEKLLEDGKLNTKIELVDNFKVKVDSTKFQMNKLLVEDISSLNLHLEVKYTNEVAKKENLCHVMRTQLTVNFVQPFYFKIVKLNDLDEENFELTFLIRNLLSNETINFLLDDCQNIELKQNDQIELKSSIKKLDWKIDFTNILNLKYLNKSLVVSISNDDLLYYDKYLQIVYKCPIEMELNYNLLSKDVENKRYFYLVILSCHILALSQENVFKTEFEINVNYTLTHLNKFTIKSNKQVEQFNLITQFDLNSENEEKLDKYNILFDIESIEKVESRFKPKWKMAFNFRENKFFYLPN